MTEIGRTTRVVSTDTKVGVEGRATEQTSHLNSEGQFFTSDKEVGHLRPSRILTKPVSLSL